METRPRGLAVRGVGVRRLGATAMGEVVWLLLTIRVGQRALNVMMPRAGSYGETPTVTRSPGTTLIRNRRIRPLSCASTSWPESTWTRYKPPLCTAETVP